jgi:predicted RNase H-like HicB family nuclease
MMLTTRIERRPNGTYRAWCPSLPGCVAGGGNREEALRGILLAATGYLASLGVAVTPASSARPLLDVAPGSD